MGLWLQLPLEKKEPFPEKPWVFSWLEQGPSPLLAGISC